MGQSRHQHVLGGQIRKGWLTLSEGPAEKSRSWSETALRFRCGLPQTRSHRGKWTSAFNHYVIFHPCFHLVFHCVLYVTTKNCCRVCLFIILYYTLIKSVWIQNIWFKEIFCVFIIIKVCTVFHFPIWI